MVGEFVQNTNAEGATRSESLRYQDRHILAVRLINSGEWWLCIWLPTEGERAAIGRPNLSGTRTEGRQSLFRNVLGNGSRWDTLCRPFLF